MIPYTTIPFVSALFLVAVGVLIGHMIWNRYRDQQEHVTHHLRGRTSLLSRSLQESSVEMSQLSEQLATSKSQLAEVQRELSAAQLQAESANRAAALAEKQLAQEHQARTDLAACLADEERQRQAAEQALLDLKNVAALQAQQLAQHTSQQLADAHQRQDELRLALEAAHREQRETSERSANIQQQLKTTINKANAAERCTEVAQQELLTAKRKHADLEQQLDQLLTANDELTVQVQQLLEQIKQGNLDKQQLQARLEQSTQKQQQLESQLAQSQQQQQQLEVQLAKNHQQLQLSLAQEQQSHRDHEQQAAAFSKLHAQHATLTMSFQELETQLETAQRQSAVLEEEKQQFSNQLNSQVSELQTAYKQQTQQLDSHRESLAETHKRYQHLHNEHQALQAHCLKLTEQLAAVEGCAQQSAEALSIARQELSANEIQAAEMTRDLEALANRLRSETQQRNSLTHELQASREREVALSGAIEVAQAELQATKNALTEHDTSWQAKFANAEHAWRLLSDRQVQEAEAKQATHAELLAQFHDLTSRHDAILTQERQTQEVLLGLNQDLQQARDEVTRWKKEVRQLRQRRDAYEAELSELRPLRTQFVALCATGDEDKQQIDRLSLELRQQTDSMSSLLGEMESLREQLDDALIDRERDADLASEHRAQLDELIHELDTERQRRVAAEESLTTTRDKLTSLRRDLERLELIEDQMIEKEAEFRLVREELKFIRTARDQAVEAEASTRQIVTELREELNDRLDAVAILRRDKEAFLGQLEHERRLRQQTSESLEQAESRLEKLRHEVDSMAERHAKAVSRCTELEQHLVEARHQCRQFETASLDLQQQCAILNAQLESMQQQQRKQQRRRLGNTGGETFVDPRGAFSFRDMRLREQSVREEDEAKLVRHEQFGSVYLEPPSRLDDLTRIQGIDANLAAQLQRVGIYTYRQIMEWTDSVTQKVAAYLALTNEITNDDWPGIARQLYHDGERSAA